MLSKITFLTKLFLSYFSSKYCLVLAKVIATTDTNFAASSSVPSTKAISSYYGYRIHPIYGYRKFHSGIDINASYGVDIIAAESGTVTMATYNGGYGKCVIINHGSGITTLYGHNSELNVTSGQKVVKGQVIAKAGSTGLSTGPHLHFEVRVNGSTINPLDRVR